MDILLNKITQTTFQKKSSKKEIYKIKALNKNLLKKVNLIFFFFFSIFFVVFFLQFESESCIIRPYHQGCGSDSIKKTLDLPAGPIVAASGKRGCTL